MDLAAWCPPTSCRPYQTMLQPQLRLLILHQNPGENPRWRSTSVRLACTTVFGNVGDAFRHTLRLTSRWVHLSFFHVFAASGCFDFLFCFFNLALSHFFRPTISCMALCRSRNEVYTLRLDRKCSLIALSRSQWSQLVSLFTSFSLHLNCRPALTDGFISYELSDPLPPPLSPLFVSYPCIPPLDYSFQAQLIFRYCWICFPSSF